MLRFRILYHDMCEVKHETEKPGVGVDNYLHGAEFA